MGCFLVLFALISPRLALIYLWLAGGVTHHESFDGFPMFSPDGKFLVFASNRVSKPGTWDTNLFVAEWLDAPAPTTQGSASN